MIDDHDRCEWVNVSFGTRSPGYDYTTTTTQTTFFPGQPG